MWNSQCSRIAVVDRETGALLGHVDAEGIKRVG
jgi:hypothetical protein